MKNKRITIEFRAAGVTFDDRQQHLAHLLHQPKARIALIRDQGRSRPIQIVAFTGERRVTVGFVPRNVADVLAPLLDNHTSVSVDGYAIVGSRENGMHYGMKLQASYPAGSLRVLRTRSAGCDVEKV